MYEQFTSVIAGVRTKYSQKLQYGYTGIIQHEDKIHYN